MASYYSVLVILLLFSFAYNTNAASIGIITTVAGTGSNGFSGDGTLATNAELQYPQGVHVDQAGNIYIADKLNNRVRKVDTNGVISTIAGIGSCNYNGDDIAATSAELCQPSGVTSDTLGNIYIADSNNFRIRKIDLNGMITTVAGNGFGGLGLDNIAATAATLNNPTSMTFDNSGNLYICEHWSHRIRKVDVSGMITTVAGTGMSGYNGDNGEAISATLFFPYDVSSDSSGNIYIADYANARIRKVDNNGIITTVAGNGIKGYGGDGGAALNANINAWGVSPDKFGNIYIADTENHRVRKVNINGVITTVAGNGMDGYNGDNVAASGANLNFPAGLTTDSKGNVYISDKNNNRIRKITYPDPPTVMPTLKPTKKATSFRPTNKPTKKKTAAPSRRPTKKPTKKPTK